MYIIYLPSQLLREAAREELKVLYREVMKNLLRASVDGVECPPQCICGPLQELLRGFI